MPILIRQVRETDAATIAILSQQLGNHIPESEIKDNIKNILESNDHCAFVAVLNEQVVGWLHGFYALRLGSAPFCEIGGMVVDSNYRKQGIGRQLIEHMKTWAKTKQASKLRVRCSSTRTDSHAFYRQLGMHQLKSQLVFEVALT